MISLTFIFLSVQILQANLTTEILKKQVEPE